MSNVKFIVKSISSNCRGWEGNSTKIVRTTKSLYDYIMDNIVSDYGFDSVEDIDDDLLEMFEGLSEDSKEVNFEGDEECITYTIIDDLNSLIEDDN